MKKDEEEKRKFRKNNGEEKNFHDSTFRFYGILLD
jgi:hypothetical protein